MGKLKAIKEAVEAAGRRLDDYATRIVYHGSPHDFDAFDLNKIGTGEGAQAYGHGLYFTESDDIAKYYREGLSRGNADAALVFKYDGKDIKLRSMDWKKQDPAEFAAWALKDVPPDLSPDQKAARAIKEARRMYPDAPLEFEDLVDEAARTTKPNAIESQYGRLYRAEIPTADYMLDWDKPLSEQPEAVQTVIEKLAAADEAKYGYGGGFHYYALDPDSYSGSELYSYLSEQLEPGEASKYLNDAGIVGINYIGDSSGVRNAVVFDDQLIRILEKGNADPSILPYVTGAGALGGAAMYAGGQTQQPAQLPPLDPAYYEFQRKREAKRDTWRQLKESVWTLGSAMAGGIVGDLSRLGGYLNPFMPVEQTEQGAQGIENSLMYQPTGPNRYLEGLGRGFEQAQEDFAPLTDQIPQSIPGRVYNALPERAQGILRIGADLAL